MSSKTLVDSSIDVPYLVAQLDFSKDTTQNCVAIGGVDPRPEALESIGQFLRDAGFSGTVLFVPPGITIEMLDKKAMEGAGWIRKVPV